MAEIRDLLVAHHNAFLGRLVLIHHVLITVPLSPVVIHTGYYGCRPEVLGQDLTWSLSVLLATRATAAASTQPESQSNVGPAPRCKKLSAPTNAPPSMAMTAPPRRPASALSPPASDESAAIPVSVIVSTVVGRSCTPICLTVALRTPIPNASSAITVNLGQPADTVTTDSATAAATAVTRHSATTAKRSSRRAANSLDPRPALSAPVRNAARDVRHADSEKPLAPAVANPRMTTFPVMFAVKTCPSPR